MVTFSRYVALGDSFTEGVGDPDPALPNGVRGWADRFAAALDRAQGGGLLYANLAIRGRKLMPIVTEQIEPAIALAPDLVTIYAGANDIMRPKVDLEAILAEYDRAVERLVASGAHVVMFTAADPGDTRIYALVRHRFERYCEAVRQIAARHGATLVDYWHLTDYRDARLWDTDRMHMSAAGHQRMAIAVLDALGVQHDLVPLVLADPAPLTWPERIKANVQWAVEYLGPWIKRRVTGRSSGDGLSPRYAQLTPLSQVRGSAA
ncbi:SGNH/GDSL hydrolase family protein [Aeromicrobium duanguangcaii]|uniref:SGNH/GDSL hydrolase family protein n=1 Tax=Aeromicrobium duanguangcaii TaxID=2968086 RepID=A0ABY5KEM8_9ACTN|nr:SGNH/GDSL hydrolase family protein [Aeromicrobium duanguangcaii]UUI68911.1 SGNH/GDSL hydrolase family protein [Aeromicrobium duanguangcaii]